MEKIYKRLPRLLVRLSFLIFTTALSTQNLRAQCGPTTPTFTVDLTGNPDSVWVSPPTVRQDTCCGAASNSSCIQFIITLDSGAQAISLDIPEGGQCGAKPTGSLYYQINCGPQIAIGTPVCLNGPGPHVVTFCKPGNNPNCYEITSIPKPAASGDVTVSEACSATISAVGYDTTTITWTSVPSNAFHNSMLSCTTGCPTVNVNALPGYPPFVDYQVCGIPAGNCSPQTVCDTVRVYFVSNLAVQILPDSPTVCFGAGTTQITANPIGGGAPYQYLWSTGATTQSINVGVGTYWVYLTDSTNCQGVYDTVTVTEFLSPISANAGVDQDICEDDPVQLAGGFTGASGCLWSGGNGLFNPGPTDSAAIYIPTAQEVASGTITLQLITTGNGTCPPDSDQVTINIHQNPNTGISGPDSICAWTSATYTAGSGSGSTFSWSVTNGTITGYPAAGQATVLWGNTGPGTITVTETNSWGCDSTASVNIYVLPKPAPAISGPAAVCEYDGGHTYNTAAVPGNTYNWTVSGGVITAGNGTASISVKWLAAGNGSVSLTQTNTWGCDTTVQIPVTIHPKPVPVINGPTSLCESTADVNYTITTGAGYTYLWAISGGIIKSGATTSSVNVDWGAAGVGNLTCTVTSPQGCDSTVSLNVTLNPAPEPDIIGPYQICAGSQEIYQSPFQSGVNINWIVSGGTLLSGQGTQTITVYWGTPGNHSVTVSYTNPATGCDSTTIYQVEVLSAPAPLISGPAEACQFTGNEVYTSPTDPNAIYTWTVNGGNIVQGQGTGSLVVDWTTTGSGSIILYAQDTVTGCDSSVTYQVTVHPKPEAVINPDTVRGCVPEDVFFDATASQNGQQFHWNFGNGATATGSSAAYTYTVPNAYDVTLIVTGVFGCTDTAYAFAEIYPSPVAAFKPIYNRGDILKLPLDTLNVLNQSVGGFTYLWDFGDGSTSTQFEPSHMYQQEGEYPVTLWVTNVFGCKDSVVHIVKTLWDVKLFIPNAFTPNGDGINEFFYVVPTNVSDFNILIADRWGNIIFESNDPNFRWNGTFEGQDCQEGAYVFVVKAKDIRGDDFTRAGTITLLR